MGRGAGFINSEQYARRLGANYVTFRKAVAHKKGTLGSRGGTGYTPPQVKELAEKIAPPTTHAGAGDARPLWSPEEIERFEAEREEARRRGDAPAPNGRVRRPSGLEGVPDAEVERALADPSAASVASAASAGLLAERERAILRSRLGLDGGAPRTLDEVGAEIGLTRERVRQIERRAVGKVLDALGRHAEASEASEASGDGASSSERAASR